MMNPMLALKVTTYVTCIYNALATEGHLAKPITWGWGVDIQFPARQSMASHMVKSDTNETVMYNPPIGRGCCL